jgi:hypothetical protein
MFISFSRMRCQLNKLPRKAFNSPDIILIAEVYIIDSNHPDNRLTSKIKLVSLLISSFFLSFVSFILLYDKSNFDKDLDCREIGIVPLILLCADRTSQAIRPKLPYDDIV